MKTETAGNPGAVASLIMKHSSKRLKPPQKCVNCSILNGLSHVCEHHYLKMCGIDRGHRLY